MLLWIKANAAAIIVIAALLLIVGLAIFSLVRSKKRKTGGCTGNCASCGMGCPYCKK